jgi:hypothetical protein
MELAALRISTVEFTVDSVMVGRFGSVERRRLRDGKESFGPEVNGQGLKGQRGIWFILTDTVPGPAGCLRA